MINKIATNKIVRKFIDKTQNNTNFYKKVNNNLPIVETAVATTCYSIAINNNKEIEEKRKPAMHYQNWICGASGIFLGSSLNKLIEKYKSNICFQLENKKNIPKVNNVIKGVQVAIPLVVFSSLLRFIMPVISTPISTHIERIRQKNKNIQNVKCNMSQS